MSCANQKKITINNTPSINTRHKFSIAPMMDHTDRHFRYLLRLITRHTFLYTEMITANAIIYGDRQQLLAFSPEEHPVAVQLGGSDVKALSEAARIAEDYGYDEINLNIGCPSNRVQQGRFGACLMTEPDHVAECVNEIGAVVKVPVTIKTRTGVDDYDTYEHLSSFINIVSNAGCSCIIIHARKALLNGLSPRENREIPPLNYETVYRIKKDFPHLEIVINGGFKSIDDISSQYEKVDGVMVGRAVCQHPYLFSNIDQKIFNDQHLIPSEQDIYDTYLEYTRSNFEQGVKLKHMARHLLGLFHAKNGAKLYRRYIGENALRIDADITHLEKARSIIFAH